MEKHLKTKQEYIDLYDRTTVDACRWRESFHCCGRTLAEIGVVNKIALHFDLLYTTGERWENKEQIIKEWIERDTRKDELLNAAPAPEHIRCLACNSLMEVTSKFLHDWGDTVDRVMFMYDCPRKCVPRRAFFHDGEEYRVKPATCPQCQSELKRESERVENKKVIITETCPKCEFIKTDEVNLLSEKEKEPDVEYAEDRERFCLTNEGGQKYLDEKWRAEQMRHLVDGWKTDASKQGERRKIAKLKMLTVVELESLLAPPFEKSGYIKLQFGTPELGKDLFLPFTTQDRQSDRKDRSSALELQGIARKTLADTNWRLMSEGISYRMGVLSGRFRAYEREEDLLDLVKCDS